jgi:uncharacterized membrane protein YciS (DUF1049 family)
MTKIKIVSLIALILILIPSLWAGSSLVIYKMLPTWGDRGTFGDMFGAINALFSGFAFAGVIVALFMQRSELSLQREELRLTREELSKSTVAQQESASALNHQFLIQTLSAKASTLAIVINDSNKDIDRGNDFVKENYRQGISGASTEEFSPGAIDRRLEAKSKLDTLLIEIEELIETENSKQKPNK